MCRVTEKFKSQIDSKQQQTVAVAENSLSAVKIQSSSTTCTSEGKTEMTTESDGADNTDHDMSDDCQILLLILNYGHHDIALEDCNQSG